MSDQKSRPVDLSVCIVSWNTKDLLEQCLRSVYETTRGIELEVVVVDNASADGSTEMTAAGYPQAVLIANKENIGFARANNQAIGASRGRYVMLLNPDTVVHSGLQEAVKFLDDHPEAAVVGCKALNPDGSLQESWSRFYPSLFSEVVGRRLDKLANRFAGERTADQVFDTAWVGGMCLTARRDAVNEVGLLDAGFFIYTEETDWCRRFRDAGWRVMHSPSVVITHFGGQSTRQVKTPMRIELARSKMRFMVKYGNPWQARLYRCYLAAVAIYRETAARVLSVVSRDKEHLKSTACANKEFRKGLYQTPIRPVKMNDC